MGSATRVDARTRPRIGRSDVMAAARWLTDRDRAICLDVYEHRVLTTHQLSDLHFDAPRRARRRLFKLYRARVLDSFRIHVKSGSSHCHYVLGELGVRIVAVETGLELRQLRHRLERDLGLATSPRLAHLIGVNGFFVALVKQCAQSAEYEVIEWLGEQSAADRPHELVRPDGLATLASPERRLTFVLELDRGTERGDRLEHKLLRYLRVARLQGAPDACLFLFPSEKRERLVARRLDPVGSMPVPTSYTGLYELDPLGAVWLPLGYDHRGRLIDLPSHREVIT